MFKQNSTFRALGFVPAIVLLLGSGAAPVRAAVFTEAGTAWDHLACPCAQAEVLGESGLNTLFHDSGVPFRTSFELPWRGCGCMMPGSTWWPVGPANRWRSRLIKAPTTSC